MQGTVPNHHCMPLSHSVVTLKSLALQTLPCPPQNFTLGLLLLIVQSKQGSLLYEMSSGLARSRLLCRAIACKIKIAFFSHELEVQRYVFKIRMCLLVLRSFFSCTLKQTVIFSCTYNRAFFPLLSSFLESMVLVDTAARKWPPIHITIRILHRKLQRFSLEIKNS